MNEKILNQFEKECKVIELYKQGNTIREIAQVVHMSFRDICKIIKKYEKQSQKGNPACPTNQNVSKPVLETARTKAYKMFLNGKSPVTVAIELNCTYNMVLRYWHEYLQLTGRRRFFQIYNDYYDHIDSLLTIFDHILKMNVNTSHNFNEFKNILQKISNLVELEDYRTNLARDIQELTNTFHELNAAYNSFQQQSQIRQ